MNRKYVKELIRVCLLNEDDLDEIMSAIDEYTSGGKVEVEKEVLNISKDVLPEERPFSNCDLDAERLHSINQYCNCELGECKKMDYKISWTNLYGGVNEVAERLEKWAKVSILQEVLNEETAKDLPKCNCHDLQYGNERPCPVHG